MAWQLCVRREGGTKYQLPRNGKQQSSGNGARPLTRLFPLLNRL
jgi:hypothetical protein